MAKKNNNNQPIDKTELVWPGKRKEVERVELPFQTIETINLPRGTRQEELFGKGGQDLPAEAPACAVGTTDRSAQAGGWKNRLIWGDNLLIMGSLLKEYAGKINLIYIDPPFATGDDFSFTVNIGDGAEVTKEPSALEVKAYRDTWGKGMQSYLQMMYDRLVLMKELLADDGTIYLHLDPKVSHYLKTLMDEVFGKENFRNEIIWCYFGPSHVGQDFPNKHDVIFRYSKTEKITFNFDDIRIPYSPDSIDRANRNVIGAGGMDFEKIQLNTKGKVPEDWWVGIQQATKYPGERVGYPTQKPIKLLDRIIKGN